MSSHPTSPPQFPPQTAAPLLDHHHSHHHTLLILAPLITLLSLIALFSLLFLLRKLSRSRTTPSDSQTPLSRRFSFSLLRRSTASFSPSTLLGHGGFASVYKATLPSGLSIAVKLLNSPDSLQAQREFHNELSICSSLNNPNIISLLGHSCDKRRRRLVLVYELMVNRSLQDVFFGKKCPELMCWSKRFEVVKKVAAGLCYLHHFCNPPVIHGDIKPSNVLLDADFKAKIGDFGLARLKTEDRVLEEGCEEGGNVKEVEKDNWSVYEEVESVLTSGFEENGIIDQSPHESFVVRILDSDASPETFPAGDADKGILSEGCLDKVSVESGKCLAGRKIGGSGRDWWWKQENEMSDTGSGRVKDYVMEWIGNEIKKERPKSDWVESPSSNAASSSKKSNRKNRKKRFDWWSSLNEEKIRKVKTRKAREWWKEEHFNELMKKKKRGLTSTSDREFHRQNDEDLEKERKKRKKKTSKNSIDWWLDGLSGELGNGGRRYSQDWANSDIPKSGNISSTPSMRGTLCYIAPECSGTEQISQKSDVYSFGVLILVLVSGRRPLQVSASPMSEFERANLVSWAKQLARKGKLLDLIDPSIHSLDKEQALLCITTALLCLQRLPSKRPTTKDIGAWLSGEAEPPHLPFEFSPPPPSDFLFGSKRMAPN